MVLRSIATCLNGIKILGLDPGIAILGFGTIICHQSHRLVLHPDDAADALAITLTT